MLPPPTEQDSRDDCQMARMNGPAPDSDDSEHEQVEFTDDFPKSSKTPKNARPVVRRPPRHKQRKQFATKEQMISLIERVCSAQDAVVQQKRAQEGESLKRQLQKKEATQAKKSKKEAKLERVKDRLRARRMVVMTRLTTLGPRMRKRARKRRRTGEGTRKRSTCPSKNKQLLLTHLKQDQLVWHTPQAFNFCMMLRAPCTSSFLY